MASKVQAGEAYVKLSADLSELKKGADNAKKVLNELKIAAQSIGKGKFGQALAVSVHAIGTAVSALGKKITNIGAKVMSFWKGIMGLGSRIMSFASLGLAGVAYATKKFIELGDAMNKMSARTGATVEWLSAMGYAAERSGANVEILEQAIRKLNKTISEAQAGGKSQLEAFQKLNIDPGGAFRKMSVGKQFELVAKRLNAVQNQAEKTALAITLFGKSGSMLLPMLGDIDKLKRKAMELGIIMTKEQADTAAALLDSWTNVKYQLNSIFLSLGEAIAPALKQVAEMLSKWAKPIQNFVKRNRELFIVMAKGLALILIIGGALAALGAVIAGAGFAIKSVGGAVLGIGKVFKTAGVAIGVFSTSLGKVVGGLMKFVSASAKLKVAGVGILSFLSPMSILAMIVMRLSNWVAFFAVKGVLAMNRFAQSAPALIKAGFLKIPSIIKGVINVITTPFQLLYQSLKMVFSTIELTLGMLASLSAASWGWIAAIGAVVGILGYIIYKTNALGKMWEWLKGVWSSTCKFFSSKWKATMDGIGDSLSVIWDAVLLGNFKKAWSLLCKDMLLVWNIWTLEISDIWDALVTNIKGVWNTVTISIVKGWEWIVNRVLTALEFLRGKFETAWTWIATSCKMAFGMVVKWISDTFDNIMTKIQQMINRVKAWTPGTGYTSEDADFDNAILERNKEARRQKRENEFASSVTESENKLREVENKTQNRLKQLNDDLARKMKMYDESIRLLKEQDDAELTAEMVRRRQDIENLKAEIKRETAQLKAENERIKRENRIKQDEAYKIWDKMDETDLGEEAQNALEDIEKNTAETADNTATKDATAEVSAQAVTMKWGGMGQWLKVVAKAMENVQKPVEETPAKTAEKQEIKASVTETPEAQKPRLEEVNSRLDAIGGMIRQSTESRATFDATLTERLGKVVEKLTELTRNSKRYADDMEQMLLVR